MSTLDFVKAETTIISYDQHAAALDAKHDIVTNQLETLATNPDLSSEAKARKGQEIIAREVAAAKERTDALHKEADAHTEKMQGLLYQSSVPSAADAPRFLYAADAMRARWQYLSFEEMAAEVNAAIKANDQAALRVMVDFAPMLAAPKAAALGANVRMKRAYPDFSRAAVDSALASQPVMLPFVLADALDAARDRLITDDQRRAAKLGGFLGRQSDGQPGVKTLWRGWQRLQDIVATWLIFNPPPDVGNV